jgi:hypothetical protein
MKSAFNLPKSRLLFAQLLPSLFFRQITIRSTSSRLTSSHRRS